MENRREFLANSAKLGVLTLLGTTGFVNFSFGVEGKSKNINKSTKPKKESQMQFVTLNNGVKMPILGLGTSRLTGIEGQIAILQAIKVGYRLIDTAQMYGNEEQVGNAIAESGVDRNEFFITTKLSSNMTYDETIKSFEASLKKLQVDYVDLLLIHRNYDNAREMYKAMEQLHKDGLVKSLGISNFNAKAFTEFVNNCKVIPAVNQCQTHIFYQQKSLRKAMQKYGTKLESWSPFVAGREDFFNNATLKKIANKYNKSVAQVALRFLIQQGIIVIPKSSKLERLQENFNVFDFKLATNDIKTLTAMDTNKSQFGWDS